MDSADWYKSWFNTKDYLNLYKHRDNNDARKVVGLLFKKIRLKKGAKVLDLACGNGRHSVLFAKMGFDTLGIDLAPHMIKQARKTFAAENLKFEIGDMRRIGHRNEFDLVVNLFSSFGYFEKKSENEKVIKSVSASLKKDGYFYFDFLNSEYLKKKLNPLSFEKRKDETIIQLRYIRNNISIKTILIFCNGAGGNEKNSFKRFDERVRLFDAKDFSIMFKKYGLRIIKKFGDYSGKKYEKLKSQRLILLAQKV